MAGHPDRTNHGGFDRVPLTSEVLALGDRAGLIALPAELIECDSAYPSIASAACSRDVAGERETGRNIRGLRGLGPGSFESLVPARSRA